MCIAICSNSKVGPRLGVQLLESCAEVGREQIVPRGCPLSPLYERRPSRLERGPVQNVMLFHVMLFHTGYRI